ncbi:rhomboid-domain-containing protein [Trematosphaeria pertusa]|uniref:Rhomboid-domain-containing protein n=1 Tax=Trematosphaeria pertusa TaxID=390896 RepID=A0A6A6IQC4_9PLEO|nr:rhomboid-domain-containing protein [Trematosphaeria pertusa]KAF2252596.1 rhomboid-domain-containing protein [Trematosphaeria pertusa]
MSFFRLTRTFRPGTLTPLRQTTASPNKSKMPSSFFTPSPGTHRIGLGHRFYSRPSPHAPRSTERLNNRLLWSFIALNCGVFGYAQYLKAQAVQGYQQPLIKFMQNFTLNLDGVLKEGRWWTMITSVFTHLSPMHLLANMLSIYYIGGMLASTPGFGPGRFIALVLGSGLSGSLGYLWLRARNAQGRPDFMRGLGFSGAVMGVGAVTAFMYPRTQMMIYGIVPVPLWALMAGYAVYDGYYLNDERSRVGHAGHIGGLAFGVLYYFARMRGLGF